MELELLSCFTALNPNEFVLPLITMNAVVRDKVTNLQEIISLLNTV